MSRKIPSESDWSRESLCLDGHWAYERFAGLDEAQAMEVFVEDAFGHTEGLLFMPTPCFLFYTWPYLRYLQSPQSEGDSDGANAFFGLIEGRWPEVVGDDSGLKREIGSVLRRLGTKQEWYDAEPEIYGSFVERAHRCCALLGIDSEES